MILGWIGTGLMGEPMCLNLLAKFPVNFFSRSLKKCEKILERGGVLLSIGEMAQICDLIFIMVGMPDEVLDVINELLKNNLKKNSIIVDLSTNNWKNTILIGDLLEKNGSIFIDAPVSGGPLKARSGNLILMIGVNDDDDILKIKKYLNLFGSFEIMGKVGAGQKAKMANQIAVAGNLVGLCESLLFAQKSGLNQKQILSILKQGIGYSSICDVYGEKIIKNDMIPLFTAKYFLKDLNIAIEASQDLNLNLPNLRKIQELYSKLKNEDLEQGVQILIKTLES